MMNQKYVVCLGETERKALQEMQVGEGVAKRVRKRCHVLLLSDASVGKPPIQREIAKRSGVSADMVTKLSRDYCTKGLEYCLRKRVHETPPRAPIVSGEVEARIVTLACGEAPDGRSRWTIRLLTERVVELGILEEVSRETIRRTLKKRNLSLI